MIALVDDLHGVRALCNDDAALNAVRLIAGVEA